MAGFANLQILTHNQRMKRLLIIGSGDLAKRTLPLLTRRYRVFALVRNAAHNALLRALGAIPLQGDLDDRASLAHISGLADTVLHFAPPQNYGTSDIRTHNLLSALSQPRIACNQDLNLPKRLVYISTSGVYGDCMGSIVNETHRLNPQTARAQRRADAEMQIRSWARRNRTSACILRAPAIYAANRLPLNRLQQGIPCLSDIEDGYSNHIHADDLARIVVAALRKGTACRVYHASDDSQMKTGEYLDAVADAFGLQHAPRISRAEAQHKLPESLMSFMNESRRLTNRRLKHELKVRLQYPAAADWLASIKHT